jgi:hypothetical protein
MKTAISLPDPVFEEAESLARQLGVPLVSNHHPLSKAMLGEESRD